jgi:hypothetical protein
VDNPASGVSGRPWTVGEAILYGGAIMGVLDALSATLSVVLRGGLWIRTFQGVASGAIGRSAFQGGLPTYLLGLAFHFFIAYSVVATYVLVSQRVPALRRRPLVFGPLYGIFVFWFMQLVVVPLSRIGWNGLSLVGVAIGLTIHIVVVGTVTALIASRTEPSTLMVPPADSRTRFA